MPEMDGFEFLDRVEDDPGACARAGRRADREGSDRRRAGVFAERTLLVLSKGAQPIRRSARLAAIAGAGAKVAG